MAAGGGRWPDDIQTGSRYCRSPSVHVLPAAFVGTGAGFRAYGRCRGRLPDADAHCVRLGVTEASGSAFAPVYFLPLRADVGRCPSCRAKICAWHNALRNWCAVIGTAIGLRWMSERGTRCVHGSDFGTPPDSRRIFPTGATPPSESNSCDVRFQAKRMFI